jgi:hypothetical protein
MSKIKKSSSLLSYDKLIVIISLLLIIITFNSCLNYYQEVQLYRDGSGKMHIDYWMKFVNEESEKVAENIGIFNPDSIRSEFQSKYSNIENVVVYRDTTDSTTHAIIDFSFSHIDSLNFTKVFAESKFSFIEGTAGLVIFSQFIPPIATGFGIDASAFNVAYKYTFSGDIITHNAHQVSGRSLTWNYKLSEIGGGKTISVTFRPFKLKETPIWIYFLSGAVLLLVLFFLLKKRKN